MIRVQLGADHRQSPAHRIQDAHYAALLLRDPQSLRIKVRVEQHQISKTKPGDGISRQTGVPQSRDPFRVSRPVSPVG
ncbi:Uncharacterised protein [Actinobacillus pleuropneumoniae]|nr:Uncharacterised protein [Actinobacillus pleuropneumoniae]